MSEQIAVVLAVNIRRLRGEVGWTQADLAAAMVAAGCADWTPATVAGVERLDRPRSLPIDEVGALCAALRCRARDLLVGGGEDVAARLEVRSAESADAIFQADRAQAARMHQLNALEMHIDQVLFPDDYVRGGTRVSDAAMVLYGRDVLAERDARLNDRPLATVRPRGRAQRLGHITRDLTDELNAYFGGEVEPITGHNPDDDGTEEAPF